MFSRKAFVITFFLFAPQVVGTQETASQIRVLKETLFESGIPVVPHSIARTRSGDFVVAGSIGEDRAWATRIGSQGQVIWRHALLKEPVSEQPRTESQYAGAVQLPDDSTLLCGSIYINRVGLSLVTHISSRGDVLDQQQLRPAETTFNFSDIRYCVPFRDGAAAVGIARGPKPVEPHTSSFHIVFFDSQAHRVAERIMNVNGLLTVVVSDGDDLVLLFIDAERDADGKGRATTHLMRVDYSGAVARERTLIGGGSFAHNQVPSLNILLLLQPASGLELHTVGKAFEDLAVVKGPVDDMILGWIGHLADESVVSFGQTEVGSNSYSASATWVSPTLRDKQVFMFEPRFTDDKINAVIFSGRAGEFVTARGVYPRGTPGSGKDPTGLMLSALQIH
jgi:hypothetical protein